jgi:hypothetical protein
MLKIINKSDHPHLISPKSLMITIGILGFALPVMLIIGAAILQNCELIQNSISAYYHTIMRNLLVGVLCAVALCLFAYKGYGPYDNIAGNLASLFAVGVAFFPTSIGAPFTLCLPVEIDSGSFNTFHFISASLLFLTLAFFSLKLFTKGEKNPTDRKKIRNVIFKICGYLILLFIALIALYLFVLADKFPDLARIRPVFWLEALSLWAFSFSWLTKGGICWPDKKS